MIKNASAGYNPRAAEMLFKVFKEATLCQKYKLNYQKNKTKK